MSRVVSLLLGAALLCFHGAFCRRVVSGESGAARRALKPRGVRGARGRGPACPGVEALPGVGNPCGVGRGQEEAGGNGLYAAFSPSLPKHPEKFTFFWKCLV